MDIEAAKLQAKNVDLIALIGNDTALFRTSQQTREHAGPCPFCKAGTDRFVVQPEKHRWFCRKCGDGHGHDAIEYIRRRDNLDFVGALKKLVGQELETMPATFSFSGARLVTEGRSPSSLPDVQPPSVDWQAQHYAIIGECEDRLFSTVGKPALDYLLGRGLLSWNIAEACMGVTSDGKILFPTLVAGVLWSIKYRRFDKREYGVFTGSKLGAPYLWDWRQGKRPLIIVEGELDALLVYRTISDLADVITLGSASGRLAPQFIPELRDYSLVAVATDADEAGDKGAEYWQGLMGSAYRRLRPTSKDVGEMYTAGCDIRGWLEEGICKSNTMN